MKLPIDRSTTQIILTALAIGCVGFFVMVWLLSPFFSGKLILPQSLDIGGVQIRYYGLALAIAAAAGYWLAIRRRAKFNIEQSQAETLIFVIIIAGFIGARLYHVLSELPYYLDNPLQIIAVWKGGLGIFGAALGGLLALWIYKKYSPQLKVTFLELLDWLTPSLVLGQIIGRFGNFVNYELYGTPTNFVWKMFVPTQFRTPPYELNQFFHPLFLYEATGSVVILMLLLKLKLRPGQLFLLWLLLYNVMRFFLEQLRIGSIVYWGIRINAIVSLVLISASLYIWYRYWYRSKTV